MNTSIQHIASLLLGLSLLFSACRKEPDHPPENSINGTNVVTIDSLRNWQQSVGESVKITDELSLYGIVTMDESNGNVYKNIYLEDHTGAINVRFTSSTDLIEGDSIRISLQGLVINEFSGVIQLDSVDEQENVVIQSRGNSFSPIDVAIEDITVDHESRLIRIKQVQFLNSELNNTWADAVNQFSENRYIEDCSGNQIYIRTSGFSDFAGDSLPKGNGDLICIVSEYNGEIQLIVRDPQESPMNLNRCPGQILVKNFDDDFITSEGWTVAQVIGSDSWETSAAGGAPSPYAVISNWNGSTNNDCESWLISPEIDLTASSTPVLRFINAFRYNGPPLELVVSTDFPGSGDPNGSSWTDITSSATWDTNNLAWEWTESGNVSLSPFIGNKIHIAFKYYGDFSSGGSTWEIDDIEING